MASSAKAICGVGTGCARVVNVTIVVRSERSAMKKGVDIYNDTNLGVNENLCGGFPTLSATPRAILPPLTVTLATGKDMGLGTHCEWTA